MHRIAVGLVIAVLYSAGAPGSAAALPSGCQAATLATVHLYLASGDGCDSIGGTHGTLSGEATFAGPAPIQAFDLNGSTAFVDLGNTAFTPSRGSLTVAAWVRTRPLQRSTPPAYLQQAAIVTKWGQSPSTDSYGLWLGNIEGTYKVFGAIGDGTSAVTRPFTADGIRPNVWAHVALTYDATSGVQRLFVNGVAAATDTRPAGVFLSAKRTLIGREDSFKPRPFNGQIDDVLITDQALSSEVILAAYVAGLPLHVG
ncbi:MAG TPA: LamG domain-containing protein [Actinomycetota bacterium]|nr:LamG domain-containing protein [Actinomycetota bacterium]